MSAAADRTVKVDIAEMQAGLVRQKNAILQEGNNITSQKNANDFLTNNFKNVETIMKDRETKYRKVFMDAIANFVGDAKSKAAFEKKMIAQMNSYIKSDNASLTAFRDTLLKEISKKFPNTGGGNTKSSNVNKALSIATGSP